MGKKIAKEIIIILLLILAIILILGLLLYDYSPAKKVLPEKVSYTTPENVVEELASGNTIDTDQVVMTYEIDQQDIKNYKRVNDYVPGKKNPFASLATQNNTNTNVTSNTTNTNGNTTTNQNGTNQTQNNQTEGYLPDKGTK